MPSKWILKGPGRELWEFGREGGFRELTESPALRWVLSRKSVVALSREQGIDETEAARQILDELLEELDPDRGRALRGWLQIEIEGQGRDLGARRDRAGAEMRGGNRSQGISGRTWERQYEQPAIRLLAQRLESRDRLVAESSPPLLAVPPLRIKDELPMTRFMAIGFAQELVTRLSRLDQLSVLSAASLEEEGDGLDADLNALHRSTGADVALLGDLSEQESHRRLELRLVKLPKGEALWAEELDLRGTGAATAEAGVADQVASALGLGLSKTQQTHLSRPLTGDSQAYELYLRAKGLAALNNADDNRVALGLVDQALELDDSFAEAHALRGYLLWRDYFSGWGAVRDTLELARRCVDRAIALNPRCIDARYTRIRICWDLGLLEDALAEGRHAIEDSPHLAEGLICLARALNNGGMADLSLKLVRLVLGREPQNLIARKLLLWGLCMIGDYEQAATMGQLYHSLHPADGNTAWAIAGSMLANGQAEEAAAVCSDVLAKDRTDATNWLLLGYIHEAAGDHVLAKRTWGEGSALVAARVDESPTNLRVRAWYASLLGCLGDRERVEEQAAFINKHEARNGYLAYRLTGAFASAGARDAALEQLKLARDQGFFSVQLLRFEERLSFRHLVGGLLYEQRVADLEQRVNELRDRYVNVVEDLTGEGDD